MTNFRDYSWAINWIAHNQKLLDNTSLDEHPKIDLIAEIYEQPVKNVLQDVNTERGKVRKIFVRNDYLAEFEEIIKSLGIEILSKASCNGSQIFWLEYYLKDDDFNLLLLTYKDRIIILQPNAFFR